MKKELLETVFDLEEINSQFTEIYPSQTNYIHPGEIGQEALFTTDLDDEPRIYFPEIVSNDAPPGLFDGTNCRGYSTMEEATEKLRVNILTYVKQHIDPKAKTRILFWRILPEINQQVDFVINEKSWYGYARLGIYCE